MERPLAPRLNRSKYLFIYSFPKINRKFSIASRVRISSRSGAPRLNRSDEPRRRGGGRLGRGPDRAGFPPPTLPRSTPHLPGLSRRAEAMARTASAPTSRGGPGSSASPRSRSLMTVADHASVEDSDRSRSAITTPGHRGCRDQAGLGRPGPSPCRPPPPAGERSAAVTAPDLANVTAVHRHIPVAD